MRTRLVTQGGDTISLRAEDGEESEEAAVHGWLGRRYSSVQYSTVQFSTVQYSIVQYSTVQYRLESPIFQNIAK